MALRPVEISPKVVRPLPKDMWGTACYTCNRPEAKWHFESPQYEDPMCICSICFLYKSEWGRQRREDIRALIAEIEKEHHLIFLRNERDELIAASDADRIFGTIVLTSAMFAMRSKVEARSDK